MSVLLFDTDCELYYTRAKELGLPFIRMPYTLDGKEYFDDLGETDMKHFYERERQGSVPITSALNPENYKDILTPYFEKGEDVYYVSFSHAMSGTFNQLQVALNELKEKFPERKCEIFNTNSISMGAGIQVEYAGQLLQQGLSCQEIFEKLKDFTDKSAMYFAVDDLMHLKRGGRLSAGAAAIGTVLGLKPVLTINENGSLAVFKKIIGRKKALDFLAETTANDLADTSMKVYVMDADSKQDGDYLADAIAKKRPDAKIQRQTIGPVIGTHCGAGTVGVIFVADKRPIALAK